jgi:glycosyltransferase involved in cell wall biosynthesis
MEILFCTPSFHHPTNPLASIFFEDQVKAAMGNKNNMVFVIAVNMIAVKNYRSFRYLIPEFNITDTKTERIYLSNFISFPKMKRFNFKMQLLLMKVLFRKYLNANDLPQIIHAQQYDGGAFALWAKRKFSVRFVLTEHSSIFARNLAKNWEILLAQKIYSESSYNIAVSKEFAGYLSERFRVQFNYLPNVVDTDFFTPGIKSEAGFIFVNVANLDDNKNHKLLIESFSKYFKGSTGFELIIVGDGMKFSELNCLIDNLEIRNQVKLLGKLSRNEIKEILGRSSCFVLSSTYETFGIVIIEAMSCGLPAVSTRSKGPESIIVDKKLGILCENNITSLGEALLKATEEKYDPGFIRNYVIMNFSISSVSDTLAEIYKKYSSI